jgi:hypothetical protein
MLMILQVKPTNENAGVNALAFFMRFNGWHKTFLITEFLCGIVINNACY